MYNLCNIIIFFYPLNHVFNDIKKYTHCRHALPQPDISPEESMRQTLYAFAYIHIFNPPLQPRLIC